MLQLEVYFLCSVFFFLYFIYLFYLFIYDCVGSLSFRVRAFSSCGKWGPLFIAVRGPLFIAACVQYYISLKGSKSLV